jgi:hypothetical protein
MITVDELLVLLRDFAAAVDRNRCIAEAHGRARRCPHCQPRLCSDDECGHLLSCTEAHYPRPGFYSPDGDWHPGQVVP